MSEPMIISLQEVRFRQGTAHMAYATLAWPRYLPLIFDDTSPDQIFLFHEQLHQYCRLHIDRSPHANVLHVSLPVVPEFLVLNQHGPFTIAAKRALDDWLARLPLPAVISGDFNDAIWPQPPLRRTYLLGSHLCDPLYRIRPLPTGPAHTRGGKGLDAFLVPTVLWDTLCPTSYGVKTFPSAGDHAGLQMYTSAALPSIEPPDRSMPNSRHWCSRDLKKVQAHFLRWMRGLPTDMPIQEKSECILQEVNQYVTLRQKPQPREDPVEQNLLSRLRTTP